MKITLREFQSFDSDGAGISEIKRINILVGPNNAGKSKILRAIDRTIREHDKSLIAESGGNYFVDVDRTLTEAELKTAFPETVNYSSIGNAWEIIGKNIAGTSVTVRHQAAKGKTIAALRPIIAERLHRFNEETIRQILEKAVTEAVQRDGLTKFSEPVFYIAAERDVKPEGETNTTTVAPNGDGVTNLFRQILTTAGISKEPIEQSLLGELNTLLAPDHRFSRIQILRLPSNGEWEIFLEEEGKGLVPLSQCGSGLRTLIHLLAYTNLVAKREDGKLCSGTFLLEELENCLHPHVQRNLFAYLDDIVVPPSQVFLTTHSSICLDYFQGHDDVVLTQVYQENGKTRSRPIEAFQDRTKVLDRLGTRASDALQTNAVVWVEGPSDRIYLKAWLRLCEATIREGRDFTIMFYGGDLLSHLTLDETTELAEYVRLLRINRNSAILIDSDKRRANEPLAEVKLRLKDEADAENKFVWITAGKEIENYIAPKFLADKFGEIPEIPRYDPPWVTLAGLRPTGARKGLHRKVEFAEFVASHATADDFQFDWREKTNKLITFIDAANHRI